MEKVKISIGDKKYIVKLAIEEKEHEQGLQNVEQLDNDEGMLFMFDKPDEISFWMKDTKIPLDVIFINEELEVISIHKGVPESEDFMSEDNVSYVLEVNVDSGIKEGDELVLESDKKLKDKMYVLDSNGESQMTLDGGERIFSRPNTKTLIRFAKKAQLLGRDRDYKAVGSRLFKFINTQNSNKSDFVEVKEEKSSSDNK